MSIAPPTAPLLCCLLATACASGPRPAVPADPADALQQVRTLLDAERDDDARWLLDQFEASDFRDEDRARYALLRGTVEYRQQDHWDAFEAIRDFADDHRFSSLTPAVEELHYRIGAALVRSEGGFWIFQNDRDDGEIVLREFIERYPSSRWAADALRDLGEVAVLEERWMLAQRRFREIVEFHPTSEWVALARFRIAITAFRDLVGPAYDLDAMQRARNELAAYLDQQPENPEFRGEAEEALATVEDWIAERHQLDASFYRTLGEAAGERFHLRRLLQQYPEDPRAERARERLAELGAGPQEPPEGGG